MSEQKKLRLVFAITGASAMPLAQILLKKLQSLAEIHLIISNSAKMVLEQESGPKLQDLEALATKIYANDAVGAGPASGSWQHQGMIICPCSMRSLASIASGAGTGLISRAADVCLKERRTLLCIARESPLNLIHLQNMLNLTQAGAIIMPFCPAFYLHNDLEQILDDFANHALDLLKLDNLNLNHNLEIARWQNNL